MKAGVWLDTQKLDGCWDTVPTLGGGNSNICLVLPCFTPAFGGDDPI